MNKIYDKNKNKIKTIFKNPNVSPNFIISNKEILI